MTISDSNILNTEAPWILIQPREIEKTNGPLGRSRRPMTISDLAIVNLES